MSPPIQVEFVSTLEFSDASIFFLKKMCDIILVKGVFPESNISCILYILYYKFLNYAT